MKSIILLIVIGFFSFTGHAQYGFLPVIDSSMICAYNQASDPIRKQNMPNPMYEHKEKSDLPLFYIVTDMPAPKKSMEEAETMLKKGVKCDEQQSKTKAVIYFQCVVNCRGEAGDFQIIHCPDDFIQVGNQIVVLLRQNLNEWESPRQRNQEVDLLAKIKVELNDCSFKVKAPVY